MVIGIDNFGKLPKFKEALRTTGTIHVVVVSGFNVSLVFNMIIKLIGSPYKTRNIIIGVAATFLYSILSGFEAPVIRAWIMGSLASIGKFYGRSIDIFQLILFSASILVLINPCYLESLSFQLSFLATAGLILFSEKVKKTTLYLCRYIGLKLTDDNSFLEDFSATVSAQLVVWPLISSTFGTISILGFVINTLILWVVPIITVLGFVVIFSCYLNLGVGSILAVVVYPFLDLFVRTVWTFSEIRFVSIDYRIGPFLLVMYYLLLLVIIIYLNHDPVKDPESTGNGGNIA
jgi:competence protein ComEC